MNIKQTILKSAKKIKRQTKNPHLEAEILLAHAFKKNREYILSYPEQKLTKSEYQRYQYLISKRLKGIPIAYLIDSQNFYGLNFYVNKNVLIPRPETELIVSESINMIYSMLRSNPDNKKILIIDIGTGSGCIIIALAKLIKEKNISFLGIDISKKALYVARKNSINHKVDKKIKFINGDLLKPMLKKIKLLKNKPKIIIIANLPYITPKQFKNSPSIQYEPKIALLAGANGLKYYKQLFKQIKMIEKKCFLYDIICEICHNQTNKIKRFVKNIIPKTNIEIKKDLSGLNRIIIIKK